MKFLLSFLLLFSYPLLASEIYDEAAVFAELVEISKKNLIEQQEIHKLILDFKKKREAFIANPDSKKMAGALVKSSKKLQLALQNSSFKHLLSEDFKHEVKFFAEAGKNDHRH